MFSWPSISWTTLRSAPCSIRCVANECLNVCGDISFMIPAARVYFFTILNKETLLIDFPNLLRNTRSSAFAAGAGLSSMYASRASTAISPIGTSLSLLPFPMIRMKPCSRKSDEIFSPEASDTRSPQPYRISSIALSRLPIHEDVSTHLMMRSTSSSESTLGRYTPSFGASTLSQGLSDMYPSLTIQSKNDLSELTSLACDLSDSWFWVARYSSMSAGTASSGLPPYAVRNFSTSEQYDATVFCDIARSIMRYLL